MGDNLPSSSPTEGPGCSGARWGCGKGDPPGRAIPSEEADPSPSPPGGPVELAEAAWSLLRVPLRSEDEVHHLDPVVRGGAG